MIGKSTFATPIFVTFKLLIQAKIDLMIRVNLSALNFCQNSFKGSKVVHDRLINQVISIS